MITRLYLIAGVAAGGVLILAAAFGSGYYKGRSAGRVEALQATVKAYQKREGIDDAVGSMDDVRLCLQLGGMRHECEQLRGMEENSGRAGSGG